MKRFWKTGGKIFGAILLFVFIYWLTVAFPQVFFRRAEFGNLYVYYHGEKNVAAIGEKSLLKIRRSPFYDSQVVYRVFLTDSAGEYAYFTSYWHKTGGVFLLFADGNIFIRPSLIDEDRLISPSGNVVAEDRPLNYFIAHEVTHAMTFNKLGVRKYLALNEWIREGIADRTGRDKFDFDEMLGRYRSDAPEMDRRKSGLYLRYQFFVEFALRYKNFDEVSLVEQNPPEQEIEDELKYFTGQN